MNVKIISMNNKLRFLLATGLISATGIMADAVTPLWLRNPAISPDGKTVAFTYKGDVFTVPTTGGRANCLTVGTSYDSNPVWTPDGSRILFVSDRDGVDNLYIVPSEGGRPQRLTFGSVPQTPLGFVNDSTILFSAFEMPGVNTAQAPFFAQTYSMNINKPGQRPALYLSVPMKSADVDRKGRLLYTDKKSYEDNFRKHERSSGTNDVWLYAGGKFRKLTDFNGHDMNPVWGNGDEFYYISEKDGTLNVYVSDINNMSPRQLTKFDKNPVRSLTASDNGVIAFSHDGMLYSLIPGQDPKKIDVEIFADDYDADIVKSYVTNGASSMAVSADGKQIAFVLRGDIYVTDVKYNTTRRITDTPAQERCVDFAPDGRTLVYDSDREGYWQLFTAKIKDDKEKSFTYATEIVEEPLYKCSTAAQQPIFSPDGTKVAFLEDRTIVKVINLSDKKVNTALDGKYNYSYTDGDISMTWSPDSNWLLTSYFSNGGWNNRDVAAVCADGSKVVDLTESGFVEDNPKWALGGRAVTYATSKYGMKSHGSWGNQSDIVFMALDGDAWDKFNITEEEEAIAKAAAEEEQNNKEASDNKKDKKKKRSKDAGVDKSKKSEPFDFENRRYRTRRLTGNSSLMGDYWLNPDASKLYYVAVATEGDANLYCRDLRKGETKLLASGLDGGISSDKDGKNLFFITNNGIQKLNLDKGTPEMITFEALYDRSPSKEREYIYEHMLRQVNDKFYETSLHGVDWEYYCDHYRQFLPDIANDRDFAELLSEILGELNASHTGARAYTAGSKLPVATLGAWFDPTWTEAGLKVSDVVKRGPLDTNKANIKAGDVILAIDGEKIDAGADYSSMLEGKIGKKVRLSVRKADGKTLDVTVRPIGAGELKNLLYERWVARNEHIADSISGGKIGYVHVRGMDSSSYNDVFERLLGKYRNCDAVVVDTRYNGGGWLHNDLAVLLSGKEYVRFTPRGRYIGSEPFSQWYKPSVMLVNEANYSDAHGSPFAYQTLKIGDIVGAPVPGTMTAVWWETQINPQIVFGIPQVTNSALDGTPMENNQLNPELVIYNNPGETEAGRDAQLEGAVRHLMQKTSGK